MRTLRAFFNDALREATQGSTAYHAWMAVLTALMCCGAWAYSVQLREGMIVTNRQIKFDRVPAGKHVACIAPLRADPADPQVMAELQRGAADWPRYCKWIAIATAPDPQHVTIEVQPAPPPKAQ